MLKSPYHLDDSESPPPPPVGKHKYWDDIWEEFERIYIRANAYHNNKTTIKSNSNLANLWGMYSKNIQCTIIKKGIESVVYVEDKKGPSQFKQSNFEVDASL